MRARLNDLARRGVALLVLLAAAYLVFKLAVGVDAALAWAIAAVVAVVAVIWALRVLA